MAAIPPGRIRKIRRRRARPPEALGVSWTTAKVGIPPPQKVMAFKAGQVIPPDAQYLTFALKGDVPQFFFLLTKREKPTKKNAIGFRIRK